MAQNSARFANYDRKIISIFEILGAYFTDTYFNHVYSSAKTNVTKARSLTDEYVRRVSAYVTAVKDEQSLYLNVVAQLHKYFQQTTRYTTLMFVDFVDKVVAQFIPENYFKELRNAEKDETLSSVIAELVSALGLYVTKPELLKKVIDGHDANPAVTIRMIQDEAITVLLAKRAEIYGKFLRRVGQVKSTVSMDIVDDMKRVIKTIAKEKAVLRAAVNTREKENDELQALVRGLKKREAKFLKLIAMLKDQLANGKARAGSRLRVPAANTVGEAPPMPKNSAPVARERLAEPGGFGDRRPTKPGAPAKKNKDLPLDFFAAPAEKPDTPPPAEKPETPPPPAAVSSRTFQGNLGAFLTEGDE